ncbi:MFS general substrate transporter [Pyrenochaeta sp. DS3sAY3a]|nr:MFS general substrate transporter [Pyrenochaeta sp. DS3sAY3a]
MSLKEKDLEAEKKERMSFDSKTNGGKDGGIDVQDILDQTNDRSGPASGNLEREDKETRRIIRKIDLRLLPTLAIIYAFALIDRVNLPNARIAGMDEDLGLSVGSRYSILTMIFFIPYIIFQFPANIVIRKLGPAVWLPSLVVCWGAVTIGMGFVTHWTQALGCRIILGVLEAGYYPGCVFLLSCWYVRFEVQKRFSGFYLLALLASGFSNILAWGLSEMKGLGGLNGWQWIFAIEGAITILLGFMGYVTIIDFPDKASNPSPITKHPFLTVQESTIVLARIQRDRGDAVVDKLTWATIRHHLKDWKIWEFAWLYFLNNVVAYSWGYFLPIILRNDMGYSVSMSQIMSFPPYVLAAAWMFATAWVADRYRKRGLIIIFNCSWAVIGVCMMAFVKNPQARYAGVVFLGVSGANANVPSLLSYMHNNIVGQMKRSIASALLIGGGACGGIAASNIFRQQDAPKYTPAMAVVIATQVLSILHVLKNFYIYTRANRKAGLGERILEGQEGLRQTL